MFFQFRPNTETAPTTTLLDGFEANPYTALNGGTWAEYFVSASRATDHVTQGTYSWRLRGDSNPNITGGFGLSDNSVHFDLTAFTKIYLDVFASTVPSDTAIVLDVSNGTDVPVTQSPDGTTGAFTLELDISSLTPRDDCSIQIFAFGSLIGGNTVFNIDNLRAS